MTAVSSYVKQAQDLLDSMSVSFSAVLIGSDCPKFCEDTRKGVGMSDVNKYPRKTHIHGKHYRCTFARRTKVSEADGRPIWADKHVGTDLVIDFWNSYADEETLALGTKKYRNGESVFKFGPGGFKNKPKVTAYDVLTCIQKSDVGTFEDFCADFDYDSDSRQAEQTYHAVVEEWRKVRAFFTADELEKLQEVQ